MYPRLLQHQTNLLGTLANTTRMSIVRLLSQRQLTVRELQRMLGVSQANVSQHLHLLRGEQVVLSQRRGKEVAYALTHPDFLRIADIAEGIVLRRMKKRSVNHRTVLNPATAQDPVCGMNVQPATAAASCFHKGTTLYFCGRGCLHAFKKNSVRYVP